MTGNRVRPTRRLIMSKVVTTEITIDFTNLDSMAEAVGLGITTPEQLAQHIGCELNDDGVLVLDDCPMYADDGNAEIEYDIKTTPVDAAQQYVSDGDWGDCEETSWVTVYTYRKGINDRGEVVHVGRDSHKIELSPPEPECIDGNEHIWKSPFKIVGGCKESPGVYGHGGGVLISECCMICGCKRTTDTWAQDSSDGEQGLTSVSYSEGEYADEVNARHIQRAKDALEMVDTEQTGQYAWEWIDTDGDAVGADDDELREYGIALLIDENTPAIHGTLLSASDE